VRTGRPAALILHTYRFAAHSKGDDVRDPKEVAGYKEEKDPLTIQAARLSAKELESAEPLVMAIIEDAFSRAYADPFPDAASLGKPVSELTL
jgi:TPP-dependent pyruvate/acetoin dehydrogenase alpha subunit